MQLKVLAETLKGTPLGWGIMIASAAAGTAALVNYTESWAKGEVAIKDANEAIDKNNSIIHQNNSNISQNQSELETNKEKIEELRELQANGEITTKEELEIANLQQQNKLIEQQIKDYEELNTKKTKDNASESAKKFEAEFGGSAEEQYKNVIDSNTNNGNVNDLGLYNGLDKMNGSQSLVILQHFKNEYDEAQTAYDKAVQDLENGVDGVTKQTVSDAYDDLDAYSIYLEDTTAKVQENASSLYQSLLDDESTILKSMNDDGTFDDEATKTAFDDIQTWKKIFAEYVDGYSDAVSDTDNSNNSLEKSTKTTAELLEEMLSSFSSLEDKASLLSSVNKEMEDGGNIGYASLSKILETYPQMEDALYDYMSGIISEEQLFSQLENCYNNDANNYINSVIAKNSTDEQFFTNLKQNYPDLFNELATVYGYDVENWTSMAKAKEEINNKLISALGSNWATYYKTIGNAETGVIGGGYDDSDEALVNPADAERHNQESDRAKEIINNAHEAYLKLSDIAYDSVSSSIDLSWNGLLGYDSSTSSTIETFNFIERAIQRIQNAYAELESVSGNVYKNWTNRNNALISSMSTLQDEINTQNSAYDTYMSKYNSAVPEGYRSLIENGGIDIQDISDDGLKESIKAAQDWYDKAQDASKSAIDLKEQLSSLAKTNFDNISSQFDEILGKIDAVSTQLSNENDLLEAQGLIASERLYEYMAEQEQSNLTQLEKERTALINAMNSALNSGKIEKYSTSWYEMQSGIDNVTTSIQDATKSLVEYNNEIRQISWDAFDFTRDSVNNLIDESEFLIGLLDEAGTTDQNGNLNENGIAKQALLAQKYALYMNQADEYAKEMLNIEKQLADDPYDQELINRKNELIKAQQDSINSANDEKSAIKDLISDSYDKQLDSLSTIIDKYKDLMSTIKDAYDYQKSITEQTKKLAELQKIYDANKNDLSEQGQKTIQELKIQIEEAKTNLKETQYDKQISDTERLLDELQDEAKTVFDERLEKIDSLLEQAIDESNLNAENIGNTLNTIASGVGYSPSDALKQVWSDNTGGITAVLSNYGTLFTNNQTKIQDVVNEIKNFTKDMRDNSNYIADRKKIEIAEQQAAQEAASSSSDSGSDFGGGGSSSSGDGGSSDDDSDGVDWIYKYYYPQDLNVDTSIIDRLKSKDFDAGYDARAQYYRQMGGSGEYYSGYDQNVWMLDWMKSHNYRRGTKNARSGINLMDENGIGSEVILTKDGILKQFDGGEHVFNSGMVDNLWRLANDPANYLCMTNMPNISMPKINVPDVVKNGSNISSASFGDISVSIDGSDIHDAVSFQRELLNSFRDRKIQRGLQEVTIGQAMGNNSLNIDRF